MKRPAFQFYPADWRKDSELQSCSIAARGLWVEMICIMHECDPYGHLVVNGKAMTVAQLSRLIGETPKTTQALLDELESAGVFARTADGCIYSKRMVKDEQVRNARAKGGEAGGEHGHKGALHGKKGGRPRKEEGGLETPLKTPLGEENKPPPSSSTSVITGTNVPDAVASPEQIIFGIGLQILTRTGISEKSARFFLGKHIKANKTKLAEVIGYLAANPKIEPRAYIEAAMKPKERGFVC